MSLPEIRPMSFGQTLDRSLAFCRSHFRVLALICLIPGVIVSPLTLLIRGPVGVASDPNTLGRRAAAAFGYLIVVMFAHFLAMSTGALAISEIYLGRKATVSGAYRGTLARFGALLNLWLSVWMRVIGCFLIGLVVAIAIITGVALASPNGQSNGIVLARVLVIGAISAAPLPFLWYAFSIQVLLVEQASVGHALQRGRQLTKGLRGQIFLTLLFMLILAYMVGYAAQAPLTFLQAKIVPKGGLPPVWLALIGGLMTAANGVVTTPPLAAALTLLYYNTRVLREGLDLQLMLERLGPGTVASRVPSPDAAPERAIPTNPDSTSAT
jgi:hypothetical protein